jgi:hypothetical protein
MLKRFLASQPDPVGEAIVRLISDEPRTREELLEALLEEGHDLGDVPQNTVAVLTRNHRRFHQLSDQRLVDVVTLFEGAVVTTLIDDACIEWRRPLGDQMADLTIVRLIERSLPAIVVDGSEIKRARGVSNSLHAKHWLFDTEEGKLTRMRIGPGRVEIDTVIESVPQVADDDVLVKVIEGLAETITEQRVPASLVDFMVEVAMARADVFGVERPPLTELLAAAGLVVRDDNLVPTDMEWEDWLTAEAESWGEEE